MSVDTRSVTLAREAQGVVWDALTNPTMIEGFHPACMRVAPLPRSVHELRSPADGASLIRQPLVSREQGMWIEFGFEPAWIDAKTIHSRLIFGLSDEGQATKVELTQTDCAPFGIGATGLASCPR